MAPTVNIDNVSQQQSHGLRTQEVNEEQSYLLRSKRKLLNNGVDTEENDRMLKIKRVDRKKSKGSNTVVEGMEVDVDNGQEQNVRIQKEIVIPGPNTESLENRLDRMNATINGIESRVDNRFNYNGSENYPPLELSMFTVGAMLVHRNPIVH